MATTILQTTTPRPGAYLDDILDGSTPVNKTELDVFTNDPVKIAFGGLSKVVDRAVRNGGDILNLSK